MRQNQVPGPFKSGGNFGLRRIRRDSKRRIVILSEGKVPQTLKEKGTAQTSYEDISSIDSIDST